MCGIAGVLVSDANCMPSRAGLQRMAAVLAHRGPDDDGFYLDGPLGLGHRRLRIIDVAGGRQPILTQDKKKAIVFNGEIYNFRSLRETLLQRGDRKSTRLNSSHVTTSRMP